jgi:hypothetical protein
MIRFKIAHVIIKNIVFLSNIEFDEEHNHYFNINIRIMPIATSQPIPIRFTENSKRATQSIKYNTKSRSS